MTSACILGCAGPELSDAEREFFAEAKPWGFILFKRNVVDREQLAALTAALRASVRRPDAPILIDQEGGRVQRMGPPHWPRYPSGRAYLEAARGNLAKARELVRLGARLMAHDLAEVGINVDCVPVLDVPLPDAHAIIGDRAYGADAETIAVLGRAAGEGLLAGGVLPVIKHIPGHGRALSDSHMTLPLVDASRKTLEAVDFLPFCACSDMPMAMTAHVVYAALDKHHPATTSKKVIRLIRRQLGFDGLLMTDDLSMKALEGSFEERARASIHAGCDVVLHCNGDMAEMAGVVAGCGRLNGKARRRAGIALARIVNRPEPLVVDAARAAFDDAFGGAVEAAAAGPKVGE